MRSYLKYLACLLVISVSSCKKFIDLLPVDQANSENSFKSPADANLAIAGIYDALHSNAYAQDMALLTELISDNARIQPSRQGGSGVSDNRELDFFNSLTKTVLFKTVGVHYTKVLPQQISY